jgi:hypothetical protein
MSLEARFMTDVVTSFARKLITCIGLGALLPFGCLCLSLAGCVAALSAEISKVNVPGSKCHLKLTGRIEVGDLERLKIAVPRRANRGDRSWDDPVLCLNSPAGAFEEGVSISEYVLERAVGTAVLAGDECYSSCALIFMAGTRWEGDGDGFRSRTLHVLGKLGFHAPYCITANSEAPGESKRYNEGIRDAARVVALNISPNGLLVETAQEKTRRALQH